MRSEALNVLSACSCSLYGEPWGAFGSHKVARVVLST